jgi:5-methylcytosine-specific restriction protein A
MRPHFLKGHTYVRKADIHSRFGGQEQGGIITPTSVPAIFLVTGSSGAQHGYQDGWQEDGSFRYFGEGQVGDMDFVRGNRAVRDHAVEGKDLHLFENQGNGTLEYLGQFLCDGYDIVRAPDREGDERDAIAFSLVDSSPSTQTLSEAAAAVADKSLDELRAIAKSDGAKSGQGKKGSPPTVYERSEAVKRYVRARAAGSCEGCGDPAPFLDKQGQPYLEPHHTERLADGGPDHPENVIALCPNCHRRVHSSADGEEFNSSLRAKLGVIESA